MPEVGVVAHSAELLVTHGRPYESAARLGADVYGYNPYLPGMTLFGLPRALFGNSMLTDPRLWDALASIAAFWASLRITGTTSPARRTALVTASPLIAFPLAVSGNDLPVIGLLCLGLALAAKPAPRHQPSMEWAGLASSPVLAGLTLGAAAALKATAWPALLIVAVMVLARDGRAAAARFGAAAAAVLAVVVGPFLLIQPRDLIANTIDFPLGLTSAHSPAASPLPGHLIAAAGPAGRLTVIALMAAGAAAVGILLVRRPPRTAAAAAAYVALALTILFTLAPASRWGYFVYPLAIACWLFLSSRAAAPPRPAPASPDDLIANSGAMTPEIAIKPLERCPIGDR
jgi:hypothetical protein